MATPEEEKVKQDLYDALIGSGSFLGNTGSFFGGIGSAIGSAPTMQANASLAYGQALFPEYAPSKTTPTQDRTNLSKADNAWSRSYQAKADLENRLLNPQIPVQPQEDPYLAALYSIMGQNTADTSGYDAALRNIGQERKNSKKRYQTYSAQISDLFGNLGRKSATYAQEQAGIGQQAALTRSQLGAQQAQQVGQTRSADAARLRAATEARAALGLGESASAGAAGDIATLRGEQGITDQQALGQTTIDTILANEALAKLVSSRQAGGFDMAGQQAQTELNMSYEDLLSSLANAEAQTQMQRSQAVSAGAMSPSEQVAILQAAENYKNAKAQTGKIASPEAAITVWKKANPNSAQGVDALLGAFIPWVTKSAPNTVEGKTPTFLQLVKAFSEDENNATAVEILNSDPALLSALQTYLNIK